MHKSHKRRWIIHITFLCSLLLSACRTPATITPVETPIPPTATRKPDPTATLEPTPVVQHLTICTLEPAAINPFMAGMISSDLLSLIYEPPAERFDYQWTARLLEDLPTLDNGQVSTRTVSISQGERYVDIDGVIRSAEANNGLELPQLSVTFTLRSDVKWSDGTAITSQDSILGYHLAQSQGVEGAWAELAARTAQYRVINDHTVRWEGIPGYVSTDYPGFMFPLQPAERWQGKSLQAVWDDRTPPSTGPFKVVAWESGREIRLEPNPYFAGEAPLLTAITVRFPVQAPQGWHELLLDGACDVILPDPVMMTDWRTWSRLADQNAATLWADVASTFLRMDFNIDPLNDVPSPISDVRVRQAINHCIDRQTLVISLQGEYVFPAEGFFPPGHPGYKTSESQFGYNPARGAALLEEAGWIDANKDGVREAKDVAGFSDGEPLNLTIHLSSSYFATAAYLAGDLETCGFTVALEPMAAEELYYPSADTPLFGRTYEVALFGWQAKLPSICGTWRSDRIPSAESNWLGENFSGFRSEAYDAACGQALTAIDPQQQIQALEQAEQLLLEEVPSISIAWRPYWFVSGPRVAGLKPDSSASSALWNAEELYLDQ